MEQMHLKRDAQYLEGCPIIYTLNILSKKWVIPVLCTLGRQPVCRFSDLMNEIDGVTTVMLTNVLKSLQKFGIISRIQYNEMPLRVEYSLTDAGQEILNYLFGFAQWGSQINPCTVDAAKCKDNGCPAQNIQAMQALMAQQSALSSSTEEWDNDFIEGEMLAEKEDPEMDPVEKMQYIFEYTLQKSAENGEEMSRLKDIYYVIGEDKSAEFLSTERPAFQILSRLIQQARAQDLLTDTLTDEEIIHSFMAFKQGLNAYWELERGKYNILKHNRAAISNFFSGFRKSG